MHEKRRQQGLERDFRKDADRIETYLQEHRGDWAYAYEEWRKLAAEEYVESPRHREMAWERAEHYGRLLTQQASDELRRAYELTQSTARPRREQKDYDGAILPYEQFLAAHGQKPEAAELARLAQDQITGLRAEVAQDFKAMSKKYDQAVKEKDFGAALREALRFRSTVKSGPKSGDYTRQVAALFDAANRVALAQVTAAFGKARELCAQFRFDEAEAGCARLEQLYAGTHWGQESENHRRNCEGLAELHAEAARRLRTRESLARAQHLPFKPTGLSSRDWFLVGGDEAALRLRGSDPAETPVTLGWEKLGAREVYAVYRLLLENELTPELNQALGVFCAWHGLAREGEAHFQAAERAASSAPAATRRP